jgi:DNA-binding LytR/AlgR family response regulator
VICTNKFKISKEQLSNYPYIIIDDDPGSVKETKAMALRFANLYCVGSADNYDDGIDLILEHNPKLVFLEIDPENSESKLSLMLVNELYKYLKIPPKIIVTTKGREFAYQAIKHEIFDYITKPLQISEFRKTILRFEKTIPDVLQTFNDGSGSFVKEHSNESEEPVADIILPIIEVEQEIEQPVTIKPATEDKPLIICVKSYGDYRFINANDICYLQADNNSTDIHLNNGEMITAFKTLKHFEIVLDSPFVRIHNSYIVNIDYVSRIHTGNAVCYIKNTTTKLPFSKSYKENVDNILNSITKGNYLEI